jgi:hypothetical protein
MTESTRWRRVAVPAASLALLAACGSTESSAPKVASIPIAGSSASSTATSTSSSKERPQLRLDTSDEEEKRIWGAYNDCKAANGAPVVMGGDQGKSPNETAATTACEHLLPLQPPELDHGRPDYADKYRGYIKCLNDRGVAVTPIEPFGTGWNYTDGVTQRLTPEQGHQVEKQCQSEAFRG